MRKVKVAKVSLPLGQDAADKNIESPKLPRSSAGAVRLHAIHPLVGGRTVAIV